MIQGQELKKVRVGQFVVSVTGPGHFPRPGSGHADGVIIGITENRWGVSLDIEWNNLHRKDSTSGLCDPQSDKGIGVYAYPSLEAATA